MSDPLSNSQAENRGALKAGRCRLRFSLTTFLLSCVAIGAIFGPIARIALDNRQTAATARTITASGGTVRVETHATRLPGISREVIVEVNLSGQTPSVGADMIARLAGIPTLRSLYLDDCNLATIDLKSLAWFGRLQDLSLCGSGINDDSLSSILAGSHLKYLNVSDGEVSKNAVAVLNGAQTIERLCIAGNGIPLEAFSTINLPALQMLDVSYCEGDSLDLTSDGLGALKQLTGLSMRGTGAATIIMESNTVLAELTSLDLRGTFCSIKGLAAVAPGIKELAVDPSMISVETLDELRALKSLSTVVIQADFQVRLLRDPNIKYQTIEISQGLTVKVPDSNAAHIRESLDALLVERASVKIVASGELECNLYLMTRGYVVK